MRHLVDKQVSLSLLQRIKQTVGCIWDRLMRINRIGALLGQYSDPRRKAIAYDNAESSWRSVNSENCWSIFSGLSYRKINSLIGRQIMILLVIRN